MRTQVNIRLPEAHLLRLNALRSGHGLSQAEMVCRLIDTEWGRQAGGKQAKNRPLHVIPNSKIADLAKGLNLPHLDELEAAIYLARLEIAAYKLRRRGMPVVLAPAPDGVERFNYLLVLAPGYYSNFTEEERQTMPPNVFADLDEARHLRDFLDNLEPAEAYRRWHKTVMPVMDSGANYFAYWMSYEDVQQEMDQVASELRKLNYGMSPNPSTPPDVHERVAALEWERARLSDTLKSVKDALE